MRNHLNKQRRGVALQCIHKPRLISMQTEIKRLSQVQHIIVFSSKNFLSHHHRPFFLTTTNIIVQLETENNSPSGEENYITMTTQKKFNYPPQEGADAVLIVCVTVCACAPPQPISVAPSSSWPLLLLIAKAWVDGVLSLGWDSSLARCSFSAVNGVQQGSESSANWKRRGELMRPRGYTLDCHNASPLPFSGWLHLSSYAVQLLPYTGYRFHYKRRNK